MKAKKLGRAIGRAANDTRLLEASPFPGQHLAQYAYREARLLGLSGPKATKVAEHARNEFRRRYEENSLSV